jgi:NodT family efflux transporter outer membrane factor (OMF) lipoprotein
VQRAQYEHAIAVLVGQPASTFHIAFRPLNALPPRIPVGVPSQLLERRPDIAAAERRVASSNARIGVAKAAYYPNLDLGAGGGLESGALGELATVNSSFWNAGPSAGEILYDAGRRHAHVQLAVSQRGQATADCRQRVLVAFQEVEDNLAALRVLETEAGTEQAAVTAARNSVALSTARYKRGLSSYLEVLTNQTVALTDERALAAISTRRVVSSVQLVMALGGGWDTAQLPKD